MALARCGRLARVSRSIFAGGLEVRLLETGRRRAQSVAECCREDQGGHGVNEDESAIAKAATAAMKSGGWPLATGKVVATPVSPAWQDPSWDTHLTQSGMLRSLGNVAFCWSCGAPCTGSAWLAASTVFRHTLEAWSNRESLVSATGVRAASPVVSGWVFGFDRVTSRAPARGRAYWSRNFPGMMVCSLD
jgi:hypothetical protein